MEEEVQWIEDLSPGRDVHKRGWAVLCRVLPSFLSPPSSALLLGQARLPRECPSKAILLRVLAKPTTTMATLGRSPSSSTISSPTAPPTPSLPSSRPKSPNSHLLPARLETPAQLVPSSPRGAVHPLPDIIVAATLSQLSNLLPCCHLDQHPAVTHLMLQPQLPANTSKVSTDHRLLPTRCRSTPPSPLALPLLLAQQQQRDQQHRRRDVPPPSPPPSQSYRPVQLSTNPAEEQPIVH